MIPRVATNSVGTSGGRQLTVTVFRQEGLHCLVAVKLGTVQRFIGCITVIGPSTVTLH
jgi:hypothetical protein